MTSVISFLILLFAAYSYSAPIDFEYVNTTPEYEPMTGKTIVEREEPHDMHLMTDDESTSVPIIQKERSSAESNSEEITTESIPRSTNKYEDSSYPSTTEINNKREFIDYFNRAAESSTEFNRRAIRPIESQEEIHESSTPIDSDDHMEMNKNIEPSSSVDSFGKFTGLLHDEHSSSTPEYEQRSSTPEYEEHDHLSEESRPQSPMKTEKLTKTVSIIPGKVTETKIYANMPSKTSVVIKPAEEIQLSQGQKYVVDEKTESNN